MTFKAQPAKRQKLKLVANISGASGSGKTFSSLLLAKGLMDEEIPEATEEEKWAAIAVIDTEHMRSLVYAESEKHEYGFGSFTHIPFEPPHSPERYKQALQYAKSLKHVKVIIVDSMTHAWQSILQEQQDLGGRYQDWKDIRPKEAAFWAEIFEQNDFHIITTTRAKQSYALERSETEKLEVKKLGLQPVQNDQLEYEYMVNFMAEQDHRVWATKDNTPIFEELGRFKITPEHGRQLHQWLDKGVDVQKEQREEKQAIIGQIQDMIAEYPQLEAKLKEMENHPSVKKKLADMSLDWVKRVYGVIEMNTKDLMKQEKEEEAASPSVEPEPEQRQQPAKEEAPVEEKTPTKPFDMEKAKQAIAALCKESVVAAATLADVEEEVKMRFKEMTDADMIEKTFRTIVGKVMKQEKKPAIETAARSLGQKGKTKEDLIIAIGQFVYG